MSTNCTIVVNLEAAGLTVHSTLAFERYDGVGNNVRVSAKNLLEDEAMTRTVKRLTYKKRKEGHTVNQQLSRSMGMEIAQWSNSTFSRIGPYAYGTLGAGGHASFDLWLELLEEPEEMSLVIRHRVLPLCFC